MAAYPQTRSQNNELRSLAKTMRFSSGFIRVDRDLRDRYFYGDTTGHDLFIFIIVNVEWRSNEISIYTKGRHNYEVKYGQLVTTKKAIAERLGIDSRVVTKKLDKLKKVGLISVEKLYNCMRLQLCDAYMHAIVNPDGIQNESKMPTNEQCNNKQIYNYTSKEVSSKSPKFSADIFDNLKHQDQDANQNNESDVPQDRKNTPPVAETGLGNRFTPEDLLTLWNDLSGPLPKCRVLSEKRKRHCKTRLKENPSQDYWTTAIEKLSKSTFALEGKWCSFDWLIKNIENGDKAFNGNYDDRMKANPNAVKTDAEEIPW